jgi:hypothetical protein
MSSPSQIRSRILNDKVSEFLTLLWEINPTEYAGVEAKYAAFVDSLNVALRKTVEIAVKAEEPAPVWPCCICNDTAVAGEDATAICQSCLDDCNAKD